ncbi:hypothetical protein PQR57_45560 [Paraburkholderia dipogonis]|jgi:hypothetical protein|uniref:WYL domain-containing protein n=1 Tax=Paraburkholderia dipogonis TaxID=1211383 RepID=A0ABW9B7H4_9BURK
MSGGGRHAVYAIAPPAARVRRRPLSSLAAGRPWFWLYQAQDGRFVARLTLGRLQVIAATPRAVITALRRCVRDYAVYLRDRLT